MDISKEILNYLEFKKLETNNVGTITIALMYHA